MKHYGTLILLLPGSLALAAPTPPAKSPYRAYLFTYFTGNDKAEEAIRFALNPDDYHYAAHSQGIKRGGAAGFHREVCLDKLEFNADGSLRPGVPTQSGIAPVLLK